MKDICDEKTTAIFVLSKEIIIDWKTILEESK